MTAAVRFSRQARADLIEIWRGVARHNDVAVDRIIDRIEDACRHLRTFPCLGRHRPDLDPGGRVLIVDRWLVLSKPIERDLCDTYSGRKTGPDQTAA